MQIQTEDGSDEITFCVPVCLSRKELAKLIESELPLAKNQQFVHPASRTVLIDTAKRILALERARKAMPGLGLFFGDPAWMILLDLYVRESEQKTTSISSATIASGAPATTGLRYVSVLAADGYIMRSKHPHDERSILISLSTEARKAISVILENAAL